MSMASEDSLMIDAHQHFWKYDALAYSWISDQLAPLKKDFLPDELHPYLKREKISGAISVQARQSEIENEYLLDIAKENPYIKGVVGWIDLRSDLVDERLSFYRNFPLMKGFRHVVQDEKDPEFMVHPSFLRGMQRLIDYGFCYDILVYAKQLPQVISFLNYFPDTPFIIDHLAKPDIKHGGFTSWQADMRKIAEFPKVYVKVSGMITEADWKNWEKEDFYPYLDELVLSFGVERLCYGSDWPVCNLAGDYYGQLGVIKSYFRDFRSSDINKIMGLNAQHFYRLNES
jgi:L-fuconolactonase